VGQMSRRWQVLILLISFRYAERGILALLINMMHGRVLMFLSRYSLQERLPVARCSRKVCLLCPIGERTLTLEFH